ncbi:transposase [Lacticaseibacillus thailandensis]|uniref:transposase n=1 Tax=Lacticaseibacillus thailandensis TaxID=381741 RepID=UPI000A4D79E9|nr:transposase [Lacticaseibacillus thailandensis]
MDTTIAKLRKNKNAVLNSCRYSYSNGLLEVLNRKIKTLKRNCFGFRNQYNMFIRIRLIHEEKNTFTGVNVLSTEYHQYDLTKIRNLKVLKPTVLDRYP